MHYPSEKADSLELYVRKSFSLSGKAQHLFDGLRWLEIEKETFCVKIIAPYRDLADAARINIKSVKAALQELQTKGLVEVVFGCPIKSEKRATEIRRKTLDEIKAQSIQGDGIAYRLASKLVERPFLFADKSIKPRWTVAHTGRVMSSKPNIQGETAAVRLAGLKAGLKAGQVLVHADIEQADPSVIKHLLRIPQDHDLYRNYMDATGCSRDEAKEKINILGYCKDSLACFAHWPEPAQTVLGNYVQRLADYKKELFAEFRKTRSVTTITGRVIVATRKGHRHHAGEVFNWRVQGTVADIINAACYRLLDSVVVVVPLHDAVYAILPNDKAALVAAAITERAREIGLTMTIKAEVHPAGLAVPKPPQRKTRQNPLSCTQNRHPIPPKGEDPRSQG